MEKQNKQILAIIVSILMIIVLVSAEIITTNISKDLDKKTRDILLTKLPENTEINIDIEIDCSEDECKWSVYQKGLINIQDNIISRHYSVCVSCDKMTESSRVEQRIYTDEEITNKVIEIVQAELVGYTDVITKRENKTYIKTGKIKLNIKEKK